MNSLPLAVMRGIVFLMRFVPSFVKNMTVPRTQGKTCDSSSAGLSCPQPDMSVSSLEKTRPADPAPMQTPAWRNYQFDEAVLPVLESEQAYFLEELGLTYQATGIIRKSNLFLRMHHLMTHPEASPCSTPVKRAPQLLSSIDAEELKGDIFRKMGDERMYLSEELSIAAFAHELGIEPHQLSRFLNVHLNTTYTELINSYRIHEAKALLVTKPGDSILDIAFSAGFSSKASFNRIFKKMTGMTPSEYRLKNRDAGACPKGDLEAPPVNPSNSRPPGD